VFDNFLQFKTTVAHKLKLHQCYICIYGALFLNIANFKAAASFNKPIKPCLHWAASAV